MQGPDAVTYDNLTLAHFLDRADRLAGCAEEIKALNAQVLKTSLLHPAHYLQLALAPTGRARTHPGYMWAFCCALHAAQLQHSVRRSVTHHGPMAVGHGSVYDKCVMVTIP